MVSAKRFSWDLSRSKVGIGWASSPWTLLAGCQATLVLVGRQVGGRTGGNGGLFGFALLGSPESEVGVVEARRGGVGWPRVSFHRLSRD